MVLLGVLDLTGIPQIIEGLAGRQAFSNGHKMDSFDAGENVGSGLVQLIAILLLLRGAKGFKSPDVKPDVEPDVDPKDVKPSESPEAALRAKLLKHPKIADAAQLDRLLGNAKLADALQLERLLDNPKLADGAQLERLLGDAKLADAAQLERLLGNAKVADAAQLERLLGRITDAAQLERLLGNAKLADAAQLERLLGRVADAAQLERLLSNAKLVDAAQLERLLGRVADATHLERLLAHVTDGAQLDTLLNLVGNDAGRLENMLNRIGDANDLERFLRAGYSIWEGQFGPAKAEAVRAADYAAANGGAAQSGYAGNRPYGNNGGNPADMILPRKDAAGNPIAYTEYDIHPRRPGVNRGPERIVIGGGRRYYTGTHYRSFTQF
ncbi:MAG: ribonuclease domain-containing protein [Candidatus Sulfotelmatobacter sp.]